MKNLTKVLVKEIDFQNIEKFYENEIRYYETQIKDDFGHAYEMGYHNDLYAAKYAIHLLERLKTFKEDVDATAVLVNMFMRNNFNRKDHAGRVREDVLRNLLIKIKHDKIHGQEK